MTLPNFLIIGAPKAGTGSLRDYLRQHPQVFMPAKKDLRYFAFHEGANRLRYPCATLEEYEAAFAGAGDALARGEASDVYFWTGAAPRRAAGTVPEARLIVSLREPGDRAFSIYHMNRRTEDKNVGVSFIEALKTDPIVQRGYHDHLKNWLDHFPRDRMKIVLFEDLARRTLKTTQGLYAFLGVTPDFVPDLKISNPGGVPKIQWFHKLMTNDRVRTLSRTWLPESWVYKAKDLRSANLDRSKMRMTAEEKAFASAFFKDDVRRTQDLIGMDLSHWLEPEDARAA
jgi:hypothetical protein